MRKLWLAMLAAAPLMLGVPSAWGQQPDDQTRAAARTLASEGDAAWDQGDYTLAHDRFKRAYALVKAPPLALREAECLVKMGKLLEASERYAAITNTPLDAKAPDVFKEAVAKARTDGDALRARLPQLELAVEGEGTEGSKILVDGKDVPRALWGVKLPLNPGKHVVELVRGDRRASQELEIAEGEVKRAVLRFKKAEASAPPPPPPKPRPVTPVTETASPNPAPVQQTAPPPGAEKSGGSTASTLGWVAIALGGAGLVVGGATAGVASGKQKDLDSAGCSGTKCPASLSSDVNSYNQMLTLSTVGFAVGAVGVVTGVVLLITGSSSARTTQQAAVQPWVGLGSAGVSGRF
jgi:hypothetical protein